MGAEDAALVAFQKVEPKKRGGLRTERRGTAPVDDAENLGDRGRGSLGGPEEEGVRGSLVDDEPYLGAGQTADFLF